MTIEQLSTLSDEELRLVCSELCGWTQLNPSTWEHKDSPMSVWPYSSVPDYPTDLNAMHEAEKIIPQVERFSHGAKLAAATKTEYVADMGLWRILHATARQRCIAFIATMQSQ